MSVLADQSQFGEYTKFILPTLERVGMVNRQSAVLADLLTTPWRPLVVLVESPINAVAGPLHAAGYTVCFDNGVNVGAVLATIV